MVPKAAIILAAAFSAISAAAPTTDKRIIGGEVVPEGEFTSIVSIYDDKGLQHCGGSLLDSMTVLTAGHCLPGATSVKAGTLNIKMGGVDAQVASSVLHPKYRKHTIYLWNDIGILKLSTPIANSSTITYAVLPEHDSTPPVDSTAIAAGWGRQAPEDDFRVDRLSKITISIHSPQYCVDLDKDAKRYLGITGEDTVCAGGNGKNVCHRDSGGPLIDQQTGTLIGVVSKTIADEKGNHCGLASVFTKVSSFIPWITENLEGAPPKNSDEPTQAEMDAWWDKYLESPEKFD